MEWVVLLLVLGLLVGLALARAGRAADRPKVLPTKRRRARGDRDTILSPDDEEELAREFAEVDREESHTLETLLDRRLQTVRSRRVPVRAVRVAPGPHTGRLVFADGTVLLVRARRPGELYAVALNIPDHPICLDSWTRESDGTVLHFRWGHGSAQLLVLGLDQAD